MSPFTWHTENCSGLLIKGQPTSFRESRLDCISTAGVQQVCGSGTEKQRHQDFFIHRQLSGMLSLLRAGDQSAASLFSAPFTVKINSTVHGGRGGCPLSAAAREGVRFLQLHGLPRRLIMWSSAWFLSLRATHVVGILNRKANLLSCMESGDFTHRWFGRDTARQT